MVHYSGYSATELKECVLNIMKSLNKEMKYRAIYNKYATQKFLKCSIYVERWMGQRSSENNWDIKW